MCVYAVFLLSDVKSKYKYKYQFDKNKNWIEKIEYKDAELEGIIEREIEYYPMPFYLKLIN